MHLDIDLSSQKLTVYQEDQTLCSYLISTASKGSGQRKGSYQTPLGKHYIYQKVGKDCPLNTVFAGRQPTGEIYSEELAKAHPHRDWILTRILWLAGKEPGKNQGKDVDTLERYIYIHGTPETVKLGVPSSHGCVRMLSRDVIELFDLVFEGTEVMIHE